jgi:hypothetical protein
MALSREMRNAANMGHWGDVSQLQNRRAALIRQYFAATPPAAELDEIRPLVSELLDLDAEVTGLAERARKEVAEGLQLMRQGKAARKAYGLG